MSLAVAERRRPRGKTLPGSPFELDHFEAWARRLILDTGQPWQIEDFQASFLADVFAGHPENWLVVGEGNAKTTLLAGLGLYALRFGERALIPVAASSRDQSRILYRQAKGFLQRSRLDDGELWFEAFDGYRRIDLRAPGRTKRGEVLGSIEIHAADAGTGDGIIPYPYALLDELHRHRSLDLYEVWRGKLGKRGAQLVAISTGGEAGSAFELARTRLRRETPAVERRPGFTRCVSAAAVLHEYALEQGATPTDMDAVKRCNPLAMITVEDIAAKRASPTMSAAYWERFVCGRPSRHEASAIQEAEWAAARVREGIPDGAARWLGLDVAWKWDTTAIVPFWARDPQHRLFGAATVLVPPRDGSSLDPGLVEQALRDEHARGPLHTVVMDTTRAEQLAEWIRTELGAEVIDRPQTNSFAAADYEYFCEALRHGWLKHVGDAGLTRHALNAVAKVLPGGAARFDRPHASRFGSEQHRREIDALVAASMVHALYAAELRSEPTARKRWVPLHGA